VKEGKLIVEKVNLSLCSVQHDMIKMYRRAQVHLHTFLTSGYEGAVSFTLWPLYPQRKNP
jgi:hypothetical protein